MQNINVLITGVGGQGTLLTSRVLGSLAKELGHDVKMSEVHGMAQRGGSVVTHVKFGDKIFSPLVEVGNADILLAFEKMEALRWLHFLKDGGTLIVNNQSINPMSVTSGAAKYPDYIFDRLAKTTPNVYIIDALDISKEIGNVRVFNSVLLGVLAQCMDVERKIWEDVLSRVVPPKTIEINLEAFNKGYNIRV